MKQKLRFLICLLTVLTVCLHGGSTVFSVSAAESDRLLAETPDAGNEYQNMLIFLGESTTAHLKSRGVLTGGKETVQVWSAPGGTMRLCGKITSQPIVYPKSGATMTIADAIAIEKPAYMVLSFGLNGIIGFDEKPEIYQKHYQTLIDSIQQQSPKTAIILQTVYPITAPKKEEDWHFSHTPEEINAMIDRINQLLPVIAEANTGVMVADSASVLKDEHGQLKQEYSTGDGIHLTESAYRSILSYLRTHAYHVPMPLPITPDQWRKSE